MKAIIKDSDRRQGRWLQSRCSRRTSLCSANTSWPTCISRTAPLAPLGPLQRSMGRLSHGRRLCGQCNTKSAQKRRSSVAPAWPPLGTHCSRVKRLDFAEKLLDIMTVAPGGFAEDCPSAEQTDRGPPAPLGPLRGGCMVSHFWDAWRCSENGLWPT